MRERAITVGALLAERLHAAGVRRAFGFPGGGSNIELIACLEDAGIHWVLCHTEVAAAFMACAEAELEGGPGLLIVGNGPGLASAVNGVAHAWLDRVPLLVIADRYTDEEAATTGHQVLDQRALLAPVVKHGDTLDPLRAGEQIEHALAVTLDAPRGPVHLDLRRSDAAKLTRRVPALVAQRSAGDDGVEIEAIAGALASADRPVLMTGLEANQGLAPDDLVRIASTAGCAVLTTYKAKGTYPERDPRWAGILTGAELERLVLERADLILAIGLDAVELLGREWTYTAPVVSLAATEATDAYLRPVRRWTGDVATGVARLARALDARDANGGFSPSDVEGLREGALSRLRLDRDAPLPGWRVVEAVMAGLPEDVTLAVDAGAHMLPATNFARPSGPRRFLISNGLASMGFAVPAAVAAALARPGRLAVAFTGDGAMAYCAAELETAARLGARVLVVVLNDASLSLIRIKQRSPSRRFDFERTEFDALASSFGIDGVRVETSDDLDVAVAQAVESDRSTLIDVRISGGEYLSTLRAIRG